MPERLILAVTSRAVPDREAAYDRWYADVHVGEVLSLAGFVDCRRYRRLGMDGQPTGAWDAHYGVETDDPAALLQSLFAATPTFAMSDAIDIGSVSFAFLQPTA